MVNGGAKAPLLTKEGWQPLRLTGWFSFSNCVLCGSTKEKTQRPPSETPQSPQRFGVSNFAISDLRISGSQMSDFRFETDQIREFVAFLLRVLRVSFAFFAFKFRFENAKTAKRNPRNPQRPQRPSISNFKFLI